MRISAIVLVSLFVVAAVSGIIFSCTQEAVSGICFLASIVTFLIKFIRYTKHDFSVPMRI